MNRPTTPDDFDRFEPEPYQARIQNFLSIWKFLITLCIFVRSSFFIKRNFNFFKIILKSCVVLVSAFDLPNGDKRLVGGSLSDPRCILYMKDEPTGKWFEVGRTERIKGLVWVDEKNYSNKFFAVFFFLMSFSNSLRHTWSWMDY